MGSYLSASNVRRVVIKLPYMYTRKKYVMTYVESELFRRLDRLFGSKYFVFPQVHISSLLNHKLKGQNWRGVLSKIQRKSVDFALVGKETLETRCAVELDDATHDSQNRMERDSLVDEAFSRAGMPLVSRARLICDLFAIAFVNFLKI